MPTMLCLHGFTPEQEDKVREAAPGWDIIFGRPKELEDSVFREAEVICGWSPAIERECLGEGGKLKWLQAWSAGVDKLPLEKLEHAGVLLTTASGVHPVPMAETALSMMLAFSRGLHLSIRSQSRGKWELREPYGELRDGTLAVIGAGEIGTEIGRLGQALGMRTIGVRRSDKAAPHMDETLPMERLHEALAQADYVVNVLPLTPETERVYGQKEFAVMKRTSVLINMGRGVAVDTEALVEALRSGAIGGAGLDVTDPEPLPEGHPLWTMEQVIVTPHMGGSSERYKERVTELFVHNLKNYLDTGRPARNIVDYERGY
ncbi:D-2-hydroxyacid dehydrogenase [Paenibacillus pasadenensis]|uniref:D-2-hydroxyacid dehydrogenase n=1 Tax=Paenibacillus pasadenensis TaxID=217090 RepID=UPI00203FCA53|nr:D-2-hydroxyacid dehydrogenase [Paenibacillus pasadenensis]MCM3748376.1 D-2-hydroxyacid dehydrogenase [Paenibacillus pasadenensis]